ncbi:hypothetical protein BOTBODRAFT_362579 [Botryobasidium botryosum FD-172 SS1]|uniref:RING-type domain-containing protein n=1 Tax=Botryobasidium botryosum (strain FD-172 SS1) TaxID=930990 RepID=A0A067MDQ0_BOTB1|nr:hypothetical protein BOTBODRAFT_362579 [Botryobasidium botryosum FD-172 SS1]
MLPELPNRLLHAIKTFIRPQDTSNDLIQRVCRREAASPSYLRGEGPLDFPPMEIDPVEYQIQRIRIAQFRLTALEMPSITPEMRAVANYVRQIEEKVKHKLDLSKHVECPICCDPLLDPYTVSPCGHVVCFMCLRRWFNAFLTDIPAAHRAQPYHYEEDANEDIERICKVKMMDENGKLYWGGFFLEDMDKCEQCGSPALEGHCLGYQLPRASRS